MTRETLVIDASTDSEMGEYMVGLREILKSTIQEYNRDWQDRMDHQTITVLCYSELMHTIFAVMRYSADLHIDEMIRVMTDCMNRNEELLVEEYEKNKGNVLQESVN